MADSAWVEAMQEELHQFDRLQVWELVDKPFGKFVIRLKWLWKNKKDEDQIIIRNKARLVTKRYAHKEDYDNSNPIPQLHNVSSSADAPVLSQQELDLLFGPLCDEFFNAGSNPKDTQPTTNIQPTSAPFTPTYSTSAPSTHTNMHAKENNNDQAEEGEQLQDDEFTNPFCIST
nr:copia protein [Tanacetum cinerariifolium]